ncbi:MAG: HD domain-containing protein [Candidatus Woesearchaeota archaeon]
MDEKLKEKAEKLFSEYVKSETLKMHCKEVAIIMKHLAKYLQKDEELWYYAGLLHDLDYDEIKDLEKHGLKTGEILKNEGFPEEFVHAVLRHNEANGNKRQEEFDFYLSAADNVAGFIYAYGLMRKAISGMEPNKLLKKLKDKSFAANVRRDEIYDIEKFMPIEQFLKIAIEAMSTIEKELGF